MRTSHSQAQKGTGQIQLILALGKESTSSLIHQQPHALLWNITFRATVDWTFVLTSSRWPGMGALTWLTSTTGYSLSAIKCTFQNQYELTIRSPHQGGSFQDRVRALPYPEAKDDVGPLQLPHYTRKTTASPQPPRPPCHPKEKIQCFVIINGLDLMHWCYDLFDICFDFILFYSYFWIFWVFFWFLIHYLAQEVGLQWNIILKTSCAGSLCVFIF